QFGVSSNAALIGPQPGSQSPMQFTAFFLLLASTVATASQISVTAPMEGKVVELIVQVNQIVTYGQPLVKLEVMKLEQVICLGDGAETGKWYRVTGLRNLNGIAETGSVVAILEPAERKAYS
ncbi:hypothetical protein PSACC_01063, partial [Paramicrosporidium saccamoebae]